MSGSEDSTVIYTAVSSPFEGLLDIGSLGVDGPPMMPELAPLSPEFVPKPVYPEFIPLEDDVLPAEEQPLPAAVSRTADSQGYIADSDLEEDEEDPEEDPINYPIDGGDDDDDEDESSDDDEDNDADVEEDKDEEEEENLTPSDSVPPYIAKLLVIPSPPPSPLSPWSSPLLQIPSPPLPVSPPLAVSPPLPVSPPLLPASPTYPLGFRAAMIRQRAEPPFTSHSLPLPPPIILSHTRASVAMMRGLRYEVGESSSAPGPTGGFRADYEFVATLDNEIRRDLERDVGYGITNTWDEMLVGMPGAPTTDDTELGQWLTDFITTVRQDTDKIYRRLDDAQDDRSLMRGRLNMLFRDRRAHARTALLMEREARLSREAQGRSMDASDTTRFEVRALRTTVLVQQTDIAALRTADRARQAQLVEPLRLMSILQTQVTALQGQQGPASGPAQPEIPEEAGSSS
ncbi:hypothetical protein Tco_0440008 [Tanacetum coccineum]